LGLARRLTTILPAVSLAEALVTTHIPRVAGRTDGHAAFDDAFSAAVPAISPQLSREIVIMRKPSEENLIYV
jgi:hypothetical protein